MTIDQPRERPDKHDYHTVSADTWAVHGGNHADETTGAIRTPIVMANSYRLPHDPTTIDDPGPPVAPPASSLVPVRLVVPAAQVNAPVETVGLDAQGVIGVPAQPMDAAWYNGSPAPGEPGNAILDGHLDWWTGPGVFGHLGQVQAGNQIEIVQPDGSEVNFTITGEQVFDANAQIPASMLATSGPATVSLITCAGSWDASQSEYLQRLVVSGTLS